MSPLSLRRVRPTPISPRTWLPSGGSPIETTVPLKVVKAKLEGAHPLKAWREHRGITQTELASLSAVARDLIAQIETKKKQGSVKTLYRLARALRVPIEALIAEQG
jgi:DNA-binding XRE family transcriptional regulator